MPFDQSTRPLRLSIFGVDKTAIALTHFEGTEEMSRLHPYHLEFVAEAVSPLVFEDVLGHTAVVELDQGNGNVKFVHGIIRWLSQGKRDDKFQHYQAELVPPLWMLTCTKQSRIFHDDDQRAVPDIIKAVLGSKYIGGFWPLDTDKVTGKYPARNFTVQYRESDFDFASRLMEDEGIYYYFSNTEQIHTLVLGDEPGGHKALPGGEVLIFEDNAADAEGQGRVTSWRKAQQLRIGAVQLSDHNFELPTNRLELLAFPIDKAQVGTVEHKLSLSTIDDAATIDTPGGYGWWLDGITRGGVEDANNLEGLFTENARVADLRIGIETTEAVRITAASTCRWLVAGHKFTLVGHFDADGEYVLTTVKHKASLGADVGGGGNDFRYENEFTCLPIDIPFRPKRLTEKPFIRGTQTADVVGSENAEIDPDIYGRVKVHFRWDPRAPRHLDTSCWVRVAQFWAGRNWGAQFIPRVGDEVIVTFVEGDPDRPIIIGSVYHADNMPIYTLPDNKTQSGIKTHSSPGGTTANYNEIMFEDKKGSELIGIHAEHNMNVHVENSYSLAVGSYAQSSGADVKKLGTSTTQVYGDTKLSVTNGDYSMSVGKGKASFNVSKTIEIESLTDFIHVKSPTQINLNVNGTAIADITPGQIRMTVGGSTLLCMTNDTIHLEAANINIVGKSTIKLHTPDLDCWGATSLIHASGMTVQGTATAKLLSPDVTVTGDSVVTVTGGSSGQLVLNGPALLKGATAKVHADGITTIEGSMVKVNC